MYLGKFQHEQVAVAEKDFQVSDMMVEHFLLA